MDRKIYELEKKKGKKEQGKKARVNSGQKINACHVMST